MNFPPFGGHFPTAIPSIHQFAAKFSQESSPTTTLVAPTQENSNRYTANGVPSFTQHHHATTTTTQHQMLNLNTINSNSTSSSKYHNNSYANQVIYGHNANRPEKRYEQQELAQELCAAMLQQTQQIEKQNEKPKHDIQNQPDRRTSSASHQSSQQQQQQQQNQHQPIQIPQAQLSQHHNGNHHQTSTVSSTWQTIGSSTVADYLSHLPASTLPLSLHHFLKYSAENIKKDPSTPLPHTTSSDHNTTSSSSINLIQNNININSLTNNIGGIAAASSTNSLSTINTAQLQNNGITAPKKKKKKKVEKEKKIRPKPGEIRLTTALDGSTLYCCPECHMAYPDKDLLEQHLVGHTLERRFVCDVCGAGLKRKDHLTRHKQSHNPERPFVCTVCLKAFKRKEQLTLHFVIHSGEKRHVCPECGKGFYRKDHLRKHTRSHIARRVKAELSQQGTTSQALQVQVPAPTPSNASSGIMS